MVKRKVTVIEEPKKKKKRGSLQSLQSLQDRSNLLPKPLTMVSVGKRPNNT